MIAVLSFYLLGGARPIILAVAVKTEVGSKMNGRRSEWEATWNNTTTVLRKALRLVRWGGRACQGWWSVQLSTLDVVVGPGT